MSVGLVAKQLVLVTIATVLLGLLVAWLQPRRKVLAELPWAAVSFAAGQPPLLARPALMPHSPRSRKVRAIASRHGIPTHNAARTSSAASWPSTCIAEARMSITPKLLVRSEEHTSELQPLMRISYAVFCLKQKKKHTTHD